MESFAISFVLDVGRVVATHLNYRNYTQIQNIVFTGGLHGFSSAFFLKLESNRFLGNKCFTVTVNISNSLICSSFCYFEILIINKSFIVQLNSWSEWRMGGRMTDSTLDSRFSMILKISHFKSEFRINFWLLFVSWRRIYFTFIFQTSINSSEASNNSRVCLKLISYVVYWAHSYFLPFTKAKHCEGKLKHDERTFNLKFHLM